LQLLFLVFSGARYKKLDERIVMRIRALLLLGFMISVPSLLFGAAQQGTPEMRAIEAQMKDIEEELTIMRFLRARLDKGDIVVLSHVMTKDEFATYIDSKVLDGAWPIEDIPKQTQRILLAMVTYKKTLIAEIKAREDEYDKLHSDWVNIQFMGPTTWSRYKGSAKATYIADCKSGELGTYSDGGSVVLTFPGDGSVTGTWNEGAVTGRITDSGEISGRASNQYGAYLWSGSLQRTSTTGPLTIKGGGGSLNTEAGSSATCSGTWSIKP
jgi:hypothetical protein